MNTLTPQKKGAIQMLICAILWSTAGILIKWIPWNSFVIAGFRSLFAGILTFLFIKFNKIEIKITKKSIFSAIIMMLSFFCIIASNKLTTAANAVVLQYTQPIFIILISALVFKQRFSKVDYFAVIGTLCGISFFFLDQLKPGYLLGNCVAIVAGVLLAIMFIAMEKAPKNERLTGALLGHFFTAIIGIPVIFFTDASITLPSITAILVLGFLQMGMGYIFFLLAVDKCPALLCSLLGALEPLLSPLWVFLFTGEKPGIFALIGGVVVIAVVSSCMAIKDSNK